MTTNRTKSICLRLSADEHQALCAKARAAGLSVSGLLRDRARTTVVYNHKDTQKWFAVLLSLRKHLTALAEKAATFQPPDAAIAIAYLAAIARHLDRLANQKPEYAREVLPSRNS